MPKTFLQYAVCLAAAMSIAPTVAAAQDRVLRIVTPDSQPVIYAFAGVNGGRAWLSDEQGLINLGAGKKQTITLDVRRIGYTPYYGKLAIPDTASRFTIVLQPLTQQLSSVKVLGKGPSSLEQSGFYRRWLDAQKGVTSAVFIGPEELDKRNPSRVSALLSGVSGISIGHTSTGNSVVTSGGLVCPMAVVIDGRQMCPVIGCLRDDPTKSGMNDNNTVLIDQVLDAGSIAGIEVYKRGGNTPSDFHANGDCGVIAVWTGSRRP